MADKETAPDQGVDYLVGSLHLLAEHWGRSRGRLIVSVALATLAVFAKLVPI